MNARGFRVEVTGIAVTWIVAETASKARYQVYRRANDASFYLEFKHFQVRRCPEIDYLAPGIVWESEFYRFWDGTYAMTLLEHPIPLPLPPTNLLKAA